VDTNEEIPKSKQVHSSQTVFAPILTYGHESQIVIETLVPQVQAAEI